MMFDDETPAQRIQRKSDQADLALILWQAYDVCADDEFDDLIARVDQTTKPALKSDTPAEYEASLPRIPSFLDFPEQPDYAAGNFDYLQWCFDNLRAGDVCRLWVDGDDEDRDRIDNMLDAMREQQRAEQNDVFYQ